MRGVRAAAKSTQITDHDRGHALWPLSWLSSSPAVISEIVIRSHSSIAARPDLLERRHLFTSTASLAWNCS
jgi:hypothetical protein